MTDRACSSTFRPNGSPDSPAWVRAVVAIPGCRVAPNASMAQVTTFRLGGPCAWRVDCPEADRVAEVVAVLASSGCAWRVMGSGSNLLVSDAGLDQVILRFVARRPDIRREGLWVSVGGGTLLDDLAAFCAREGLDGLRFANGIPGTVGGAIAGNAGAFGEDMAGVLVQVELVNREGRVVHVNSRDLGMGYRRSSLQDGSWVVSRAVFQLRPGSPEQLGSERERILSLRRAKHPDWRVCPTAGSFFRNLAPTSAAGVRQAAGWFLEQAGAKSFREGGARVFEKHANIIVAEPGVATAEDVRRLANRMAEAVYARFGLRLHPEVRLWGNFPANFWDSSE